jgi:hypothetical protein
MDAKSPDHESREAVALAIAYLPTLSKDARKYRVILVENVLSGERASALRWRVGFKLREILPERDDEEIGKGGDFYVEVHLGTRTVTPVKGGH